MNLAGTLVLVASFATPSALIPHDQPVNLRRSIESVARLDAKTTPLPLAAVVAPPARNKRGSVAGAVVGGAISLWAGGAIGYSIEHAATHGRCYDVCFTGLPIGAVVGAIAGGMLGWKFF